MQPSRPAILLFLLAASAPAAAAPQPPRWNTYGRTARPDGAPARCLQDRRGLQQAGTDRWYVFQVFNDCNRPVQAACDIAYTPNCDYGRDVAVVAHLDARLAPYGESSPFGHFAPAAAQASPGCFFARCSEDDPAAASPGSGPITGLTGH